jgi:hypothetical protein
LNQQQQQQQQTSSLNRSYGALPRGFPGTPDGTCSSSGSSSFFAKLASSPGKESYGEGLEMAAARRVESGRDLRANFYGKIGKENGVVSAICAEINNNPDLGWVNELVK